MNVKFIGKHFEATMPVTKFKKYRNIIHLEMIIKT